MERPGEVVPRSLGEVLMEKVGRTYLSAKVVFGASTRELVRSDSKLTANNEACRRRIESLLKGDSSGSARLAAADEGVDRALVDAVERHATKDPGMRGTLKRASVVCHPKSEPHKKIALDTEQDPTPHPSVSHGGSSASGAQPSVTTSTDQDTSTRDVTRETRTELTHDVTRASSNDHIGGDVAMEGDAADENSAGHPNPSGSNSRRRITTKRKPREVRDVQTNTTEHHVPRRILGPQEQTVAVTTQEALDGYRGKTMRIANVENNTLNLVSMSSAGALDMTHRDFSVRLA